MMGRRRLQELLREQQEPFVLETFIDDKRSQLQKPASAAATADHPRLRRLQPTSQNHAFPPSGVICLCPSPSFIPSRDSIDYLRKGGPFSPSLHSSRSPILDLPGKSPYSVSGSRITAALLLEAAMRIHGHHHQQRQQQKKKKKKKSNDSPRRRSSSSCNNASKDHGFWFLFSALKRFLVKKQQHKVILDDDQSSRVFVRDILNWDCPLAERKARSSEQAEIRVAGDSDRSLRIDADERSEEEWKGFVLESSSFQCSILDDNPSPSPRGAAAAILEDDSGGESVFEFRSSSSRYPSASSSSSSTSPSSSSVRTRYLEFPPAMSPVRRRTERQLLDGGVDDEVVVVAGSTGSAGRGLEEVKSLVVDEGEPYGYCCCEEEGEEEKDQFSPISVLEYRSFDNDHQHHLHEEEDEKGEQEQWRVVVHDFQEGFPTTPRRRKQIVQRFGRLAGLCPVDLEKRITADDDDEEEADSCHHGDHDVHGPEKATRRVHFPPVEMEDVCNFVRSNDGHHRRSGNRWCSDREIPSDTRRLVLDLAEEEGREVGRMFEEGRREVESFNTIDMMVEMDLRREGRVWWTARNREHVMDVAAGIEASVLSALLEELSGDLCCIGRG